MDEGDFVFHPTFHAYSIFHRAESSQKRGFPAIGFFTDPCLTSVALAFRCTGKCVPHSVKILIRFPSLTKQEEYHHHLESTFELWRRDFRRIASRPTQRKRLQCNEPERLHDLTDMKTAQSSCYTSHCARSANPRCRTCLLCSRYASIGLITD